MHKPFESAHFGHKIGSATEIAGMHEGRVGRLADPFGYHWEIGRPLKSFQTSPLHPRAVIHLRQRQAGFQQG